MGSIKIHVSDLGCKIIAAGKIFVIKIKSKSKQVKKFLFHKKSFFEVV